MSTYAASTSWARAAGIHFTTRPELHVAPALARSLQQASRVLQQRTKEEADVDVILERVDVAKRRVVDAGGRTSVVHQFAHVAAPLPHAHEPGFCERPQIIALRASQASIAGSRFTADGKRSMSSTGGSLPRGGSLVRHQYRHQTERRLPESARKHPESPGSSR